MDNTNKIIDAINTINTNKKRWFKTNISNHAITRFKKRYKQKTNIVINNTPHAQKLIYQIFDQMIDNKDSYVQVIQNISNFKDKHMSYAKKRKEANDTYKFLYKELQLIFIFDDEFKCLLTCRMDTGKFKRRRTQHEPNFIYSLIQNKNKQLDIDDQVET